MILRLAVLATLLAVAIAAPGNLFAPVVTKVLDSTYDPHPKYAFSYDVSDPITGDVKSQVETRDGDIVQGRYALNDPDGTRRTVDYVADNNGFHAIVKKTPLAHAIPVAHGPILHTAPIAAAAPFVHAAPVAQAAPILRTVIPKVTQVIQAAPVVHDAITNIAEISSSIVPHPINYGINIRPQVAIKPHAYAVHEI